jgi:hypothetical protein
MNQTGSVKELHFTQFKSRKWTTVIWLQIFSKHCNSRIVTKRSTTKKRKKKPEKSPSLVDAHQTKNKSLVHWNNLNKLDCKLASTTTKVRNQRISKEVNIFLNLGGRRGLDRTHSTWNLKLITNLKTPTSKRSSVFPSIGRSQEVQMGTNNYTALLPFPTH